MLKITLIERNRAHNILVPESKTIRQVLIENHIDYSNGDVYLNALPIQGNGLDVRFSHIADEVTHYIISVNSGINDRGKSGAADTKNVQGSLFRTSHAPKIYLISNVCIIVSALTSQEIMDIKHSRPDLLRITDENNDPVFAMDIESGYGSLKEYGAVYSDRVTSEGKATITILLDSLEQDLSDVITNRLGLPFHKLIQLEKRILAETQGIPIDNEDTDYFFAQI